MLSAEHGAADSALLSLLSQLKRQRYRFITTTPLTHARVWARRSGRPAETLRDVFGWNLPFDPRIVPPAMLAELEKAQALTRDGTLYRSAIRVSSLDDDLFLHSAYPTEHEDAVFFGPDTYRFVQFARRRLGAMTGGAELRLLDVGCGSGVGAIALAQQGAHIRPVFNDINPLALRYAAINAEAAGIRGEFALGDALQACRGEFDLILSNPPYLDDDGARAYRHGGERLGRALSVRIAAEALERLAPGGQLILYTGVAIVDGVDPFIEEMQPLLARSGCAWSYGEIDPDVFGEELERPVYREAERIAAVGLVAVRGSGFDA